MAKTSEVKPILNAPKFFYKFSRHNFHSTFYSTEKQTKFLGSWNPRAIPEKETDKFYEIPVEMSYRPDSISYEFYSTPLLGWVISYVNDIANPLDRETGLYPGRVIRIPDIASIISTYTI